MKIEAICPQCNKTFLCREIDLKIAAAKGAPRYCGKACSGLARRLKRPLTKAEKVAEKAAYDREYRAKNRAMLKAKKAEIFRRWYAKPENKERARLERAARMQEHIEYCRRPEYKAWKHEYDLRYKAKENYGEFAEVALLLRELKQEVKTLASEEVKLEKAREISNERRHPAGENPERGQPQTGSLGNAE